MHFKVFLVLQSRTKTVIPRDHLHLKECITSLGFLAAVIWVVTAAKQPGGGTWLIFDRHVWLASQNPSLHYSLFFLVNCRLHLGHFWANMY